MAAPSRPASQCRTAAGARAARRQSTRRQRGVARARPRFTHWMLAGLVRAGLAATRHEVIKVGAKAIEVCRVRITAAGRRALEVRVPHRTFEN